MLTSPQTAYRARLASQGFFDRPAQNGYARAYRRWLEAGLVCPLRECLSATIKFNSAVIRRIVLLFFSRSPSAVQFFIALSVIKPIDAVPARGAWPHVFQETLEGLPSVANWRLPAICSLSKRQASPNSPGSGLFSISSVAMARDLNSVQMFPEKASTRTSLAVSKVGNGAFCRAPTITHTAPYDSTIAIAASRRTLGHQSSKPLACQVNSSGHSASYQYGSC